jgi:hypothetical protein
MRVGVRQNFKWVLKPGLYMVVRVEYLFDGIAVVRCSDGRKLKVDFIEAARLTWRYPIIAELFRKYGFVVDIALPPRIVEKWGVVDCIEDIITIPPRDYPFADATKPDPSAQGQVKSSKSDAYTVRRIGGNWGVI